MKISDIIHNLVCPECKNELGLQDNTLVCIFCNRQYMIKDNIPIFYKQEFNPNELKVEYAYWNKKDQEIQYENMKDSSYRKLLDIFHIPENTKGLELGCGDGPFARRLPHKNLEIYGFDISLPLLKKTQNLYPVQGNALRLPFKDRFFDWIIYAFALHHMIDLKKAIQEAIKVLNTEGTMLIVEPNYYHPVRFITRKPNTFFRRYIFTYMSPEERWIPLFKLKDIFRKNSMKIDNVLFITPEFKSGSFVGKIQMSMSKIFNLPFLKKFVHSYYVVVGKKVK